MTFNLNILYFLFIILTCNVKDNKIKNHYISTCTAFSNKNLNIDSSELVYFSNDNGHTWKNCSKGIPQNVRIGLGGLAVSENRIGLSTFEHGVFLYNFKDSSWINIPTDQQSLQDYAGALIFFNNAIYLGTQYGGVYYSNNLGKTWEVINQGLTNKTIRRFEHIDQKLYACANDGLYSWNEPKRKWKLEYGYTSLQVNGVTKFHNNIYIATNQGLFKNIAGKQQWENKLPNHSVHNISTDDKNLYAMTYDELLLISSDGNNWQNNHEGLPKDLYTFNILTKNDVTFAGQWDGIYRKSNVDIIWKKSSIGLPEQFAATNLKSYHDMLIITTTKSKTKKE